MNLWAMSYSAVDVELKRDPNRKMCYTVRQMRHLPLNITLEEDFVIIQLFSFQKKKWWRAFDLTFNYLPNFVLWMDFISPSQPKLTQPSPWSPQVHRNTMVFFLKTEQCIDGRIAHCSQILFHIFGRTSQYPCYSLVRSRSDSKST